ncbi:hypothetical protein A176_004916 [Myxococcus hansupus]|uniref:Uncharacterized protein n=1 Tax=Pseudomyxococcus hansupus TaxID=1297742 RepID=A0A0H4WYY5_9BACT|nr:hypothetical protein A176_004916 [Myxococcus hansupus]
MPRTHRGTRGRAGLATRGEDRYEREEQPREPATHQAGIYRSASRSTS